jgi:PhzF family phenazine biosynthesis protein
LTHHVAHIDTFTDRPFAGNPAGVCVLEHSIDDVWMQSIAAELNLPETAFVLPIELATGEPAWRLRWFTPTVEVELCGHATLAAAHYLWDTLGVSDHPIRFVTLSGELTASRGNDGWIELDFPANEALPVEPDAAILEALGLGDRVIGAARGSTFDLIEVADASTVREVHPCMAKLARLDSPGFIVTALGDGLYDIVSRVFAPQLGIAEDPVTGSAHCLLGPYWAPRLGKDDLLAHQASARGGAVRVGLRGDRVLLGGQAVQVFDAPLAEVAQPLRPKVPRRQTLTATRP